MPLSKKQKYLQIALNSTLSEARSIILKLPSDQRIILEAGTPLIKQYGTRAISSLKEFWNYKNFGPQQTSPDIFTLIKDIKNKNLMNKKMVTPSIGGPYIVADLKCMDRGFREVELAKSAGASAATVLGHAPIETIDAFIEKCEELGLDSMIDMMNVEYPTAILRKLKKVPQVVVLHRGVDEEERNREKAVPYHEIQRLKGEFDIMIAVAGGDTIREVQTAIFNDVDITVLWKKFYSSTDTTVELVNEFLREIR
jgi:bifunctional enzyme Fae/Hps